MSYRTLNQIFYTNNKFDHPNEIEKLEKYFMNLSIDFANLHIDIEQDMFVPLKPVIEDTKRGVIEDTKRGVIEDTKRGVIKQPYVDLFEPIPVVSPIVKEIQTTITSKTTVKGFSPRDRDALFWCIFAHQYGEMEYEMIRTNYGKRKVDEKMKIYSWLKENKAIIKTYPSMKITNVMYQEMLSELMCVQSDTGFLSIIAFSLYYKINIYLVNESKKTYLEFLGQGQVQAEEKPNNCILHRLDRGYRLSQEPIITHFESLLKLESYQKPLKAISNYKMCELEEIAKIVGIWSQEKSSMKKPELYTYLTEYCVWITK